MKIAGMLCIIISTTLLGFMKAGGYRKKEQILHSFIEMIYFIKREISSYLTPQNEIYQKFTDVILEKNGFMSLLNKAVENGNEAPLLCALEEAGETLNLDKQSWDILIRFARDLGTLSTQDECERCNRAISELDYIYKHCKEESKDKIRLCKSVGGIIGLATVLLLW